MGLKTSRLDADRLVNHLGSMYVKNEDYVALSSATYISADQIVAVTSKDAGYIAVSKAQADVALDASDLWIAKQDIWEFGEVARFGVITDVNTSSAAVGDPVFLSDAAGGWSLSAGTAPIRIGKVTESDASAGSIWIDLGGSSATGGDPASLTNTIADPGDAAAIPVTKSGVCAMTSAGAETRTLAIPTFIGQMLVLTHDTDGGSIAVTAAAAINEANNTVMTFTDVSETITLVAVTAGGSLVWSVLGNDGVTLS